MKANEFWLAEPRFISAVAAASNCKKEWVLLLAVRESERGLRQLNAVAVDTAITVPLETSHPTTVLVTQQLLDNSLNLVGMPSSLGFTVLLSDLKASNASNIQVAVAQTISAVYQTPAPLEEQVPKTALIAAIVGTSIALLCIGTLVSIMFKLKWCSGGSRSCYKLWGVHVTSRQDAELRIPENSTAPMEAHAEPAEPMLPEAQGQAVLAWVATASETSSTTQ